MNINTRRKIAFLASLLCALLAVDNVSFSKNTSSKKAIFLRKIKDNNQLKTIDYVPNQIKSPQNDAKLALTKNESSEKVIFLNKAKSKTQQKSNKTDDHINEKVKFHPNDVVLPLVGDGAPTIKNLMIRGINQIGKVMYIWGGGRNTPPGANLRIIDTLGEPSRWVEFASEIDSKIKSEKYNYNFKNFCIVSKDKKGNENLEVSSKHIDKGLDCSGFMAWLLMNTLSSKNLQYDTFVVRAKDMAKLFADRGLGNFIDFGKIEKVYPGDIISMKQGYDDNGKLEDESHVYLSLGQFDDGSIILVDMSPPTIRIRGTRDKKNSKDANGKLTSQAIQTATEYMQNYFPDTYSLFPDCTCSADSYNLDSLMHWDTISQNRKISDPEGYQKLTPTAVLKDLFSFSANSQNHPNNKNISCSS